MGRRNVSFGKKEVQAKNEKKRKDKEQKRLDRKQQTRDGNNLDDMIAYVDQFGNITSTPPDLTQQQEINVEDIAIGVPRNAVSDVDEKIRKGVVTFFDNSKKFGFIKDTANGQDIFVHVNGLLESVVENDKVTFEITKGLKGFNAINVKIDRDITNAQQ